MLPLKTVLIEIFSISGLGENSYLHNFGSSGSISPKFGILLTWVDFFQNPIVEVVQTGNGNVLQG